MVCDQSYDAVVVTNIAIPKLQHPKDYHYIFYL